MDEEEPQWVLQQGERDGRDLDGWMRTTGTDYLRSKDSLQPVMAGNAMTGMGYPEPSETALIHLA